MTNSREIAIQTDPVDLDAIYDEGETVSLPIMSKIFGELTNTQSVRAVFGLSPTELSDDLLTDAVYTLELDKALMKFPRILLEKWESLPEKPEPEDIMFEASVQQFSTYFIASKVCDVLPLIVARTLTDSKAMFQRFDTDLQDVADNIKARLASARDSLMEHLEDEELKLKLPTLMGSGKPKYNPVLGEQ